VSGQSTTVQESAMTDHVYKTIELTGSSTTGTDEAIRAAVARAAKTIRHMDWFQVVETRGHIEEGAIAHWQVTVKDRLPHGRIDRGPASWLWLRRCPDPRDAVNTSL
jgi:dodecin